MTIEYIKKQILKRISLECFNTKFSIRCEYDNKYMKSGRIFIQIIYKAKCNKTKKLQEWHGRKWYLSSHMTEDEIIKTCYAAFKATIEHEIMEGFKVDNIVLFNPHINYKELLKISHNEIKRS